MPHLPLSLRQASTIFLAFILLSSIEPGRSQPADGFTVQERPGIVIVKPQPWSKESEATVVEFQAFIDRTASGAANAGYYEFRIKGEKRQIPTSRVVKLVVYPDPQLIKEMVKPDERKSLANTIQDIKAVIAKFPASRTYVEPSLKKLDAEAALFDAGKVKTGGTWITKEAYVKQRATALIELLKAEIARATPPSSFDLESDPKFLALEEFSLTNPGIKAATAELAATHGKLVRAETRKKLLARLADPALGVSAATEAVNRLKALEPAEDPKSAAFIKLWDAGSATVASTSADAAKLSAELESQMASNKVEDAAPQLTPDLAEGIASLQERMSLFTATNPPPQLLLESRQSLAVCAVGTGFKNLGTLFADRRFIEAKDLLDTLSREAQNVGLETSRVITTLQQYSATRMEEFTRLREEAKILADSGKSKEALAKYEAAFSVIPDAGVGDQITKLKPAAPPAK